MKAIMMNGYGGTEVLSLEERPTPVPSSGQVLIKVEAIGINPIDWRVRKGTLKEFVKVKPPMILGAELAGEITQVGADGAPFKVGDKVWAKLPGDIGAYAEYVALDAAVVGLRPANLTATEAAAVPVGATTALQAMRDIGQLKSGQRVLINGASGGVGLFAVQLAKELGASVTAVCSGSNVAFVKQFGPDEVLDYKTTDFTKLGKTWDCIFDVAATRKFSECKGSLEPHGVYVTTISSFGDMIMPLFNPFRSRKGKYIIVKCARADLDFARKLVEEGKLKPVVEKVFPFAKAAEAQTSMENERPKGKIVLEMAA